MLKALRMKRSRSRTQYALARSRIKRPRMPYFPGASATKPESAESGAPRTNQRQPLSVTACPTVTSPYKWLLVNRCGLLQHLEVILLVASVLVENEQVRAEKAYDEAQVELADDAHLREVLLQSGNEEIGHPNRGMRSRWKSSADTRSSEARVSRARRISLPLLSYLEEG